MNKIRLNLAIPDGHFSWISAGTTGYPEQRGIVNKSKGFREYCIIERKRTFIPILLRKFISI